MDSRERLAVRVNDELVLDAGVCETVEGPGGPTRLVRPGGTTLFHQVIAYLKAKPDPRGRLPGTAMGREGVAAAGVALRWGSYLAVLADRGKPLWRAVREPSVSRLSDDEMNGRRSRLPGRSFVAWSSREDLQRLHVLRFVPPRRSRWAGVEAPISAPPAPLADLLVGPGRGYGWPWIWSVPLLAPIFEAPRAPAGARFATSY
jgi:hypothetical protein